MDTHINFCVLPRFLLAFGPLVLSTQVVWASLDGLRQLTYYGFRLPNLKSLYPDRYANSRLFHRKSTQERARSLLSHFA